MNKPNVEFVGEAGSKDMCITQDNPVPGSLLVSISINLTLGKSRQGRRREYRFVAVAVNAEEGVSAADVFVDANVKLIEVISSGGKLEIVGKARATRRGAGVQSEEFDRIGIEP